MKIAVAYDNGLIGEHFGHAEFFAVYDFNGVEVEDHDKKLIDCAGKHGHNDMVQLMVEEDVAAVICGRMGDDARALLLSKGIVPVAGYMGPADDAAMLLVTGQLPIVDGSGACGGGCGGSCGGGSCGTDENGGCGCGCSGCH